MMTIPNAITDALNAYEIDKMKKRCPVLDPNKPYINMLIQDAPPPTAVLTPVQIMELFRQEWAAILEENGDSMEDVHVNLNMLFDDIIIMLKEIL